MLNSVSYGRWLDLVAWIKDIQRNKITYVFISLFLDSGIVLLEGVRSERQGKTSITAYKTEEWWNYIK